MVRTKKFINAHHLEAKRSDKFSRADNGLHGFMLILVE